VDDDTDPALRPDLGPSFETWTDDEGYTTFKIRMRAEPGAALLVAIDSLAEREARRERAQNKKAQAAHEQVRAVGGQVDWEIEERCLDEEAAGRGRRRTAARRVAALGALAEARMTMDRRPGDPPRREVVIHVDADVLADDTAAGRAHFEGGPAITGAQARRMLCEATAVVMLEKGREPLAHGRRKRRATKAQRRALLRRDGGCARPGCPETRIERLHAHHMRHWMFGGRTDLANLVLLCDVDHGLVHDHDLVLSRQNGRLIVLTPDGQHVWGTADAAFVEGLRGTGTFPGGHGEAPDPFIGVQPVDTVVGRRPAGAPPVDRIGLGATAAGRMLPPRRSAPTRHRPEQRRTGERRTTAPAAPAGRVGRPPNRRSRRLLALRTTSHTTPDKEAARLSRMLFPDGEPALADTIQEHYDRMDLHFAIGVLMGHRELVRRLAAESSAPMAD
jgi:hypothetical protein